MDIILLTGEIIQGVEQMKSPDDIVSNCRLFYELDDIEIHGRDRFKEIDEPMDFKAQNRYYAEMDIHNNIYDYDSPFIKKQNFVIKKGTI